MLHIRSFFFRGSSFHFKCRDFYYESRKAMDTDIYIYIHTYIFFFFIFNKNVIEIKFSQGIYTGREKVESKEKRQYL